VTVYEAYPTANDRFYAFFKVKLNKSRRDALRVLAHMLEKKAVPPTPFTRLPKEFYAEIDGDELYVKGVFKTWRELNFMNDISEYDVVEFLREVLLEVAGKVNYSQPHELQIDL